MVRKTSADVPVLLHDSSTKIESKTPTHLYRLSKTGISMIKTLKKRYSEPFFYSNCKNFKKINYLCNDKQYLSYINTDGPTIRHAETGRRPIILYPSNFRHKHNRNHIITVGHVNKANKTTMAEEKKHHHSNHSGSSHHHHHSTGSISEHTVEQSHGHSHSSHSRQSSQSGLSKALNAIKICIAINAIYLVAEALVGMHTNSLSLITDAGYNLGDVLVLALAFFSLKLKGTPSYQTEAAAYKKYSALSLVINAVILLVAVGFVSLLAWGKMGDFGSHCTAGLAMTVTAGIGIVVNGLTAWILRKNSKKSTGMKIAFVNMAADTFVSVVVMVAGIVLLTNPACTTADPIATIIAAVVILCFTTKILYNYLKKSFLMFPEHIDSDKVLSFLKANDHVIHCRHLNIWRNSADETEVSAHLSLDDMDAVEEVKRDVKQNLRHMGVDIVTLAFKKHKD